MDLINFKDSQFSKAVMEAIKNPSIDDHLLSFTSPLYSGYGSCAESIALSIIFTLNDHGFVSRGVTETDQMYFYFKKDKIEIYGLVRKDEDLDMYNYRYVLKGNREMIIQYSGVIIKVVEKINDEIEKEREYVG